MKRIEPPGLDAIDWSRPWLADWSVRGRRVASRTACIGLIEALNEALAEAFDDGLVLDAGPLRFVEHAELPADEAYETFIARTACVPTRPNLHDFFNALAWCAHPALKRRLNELQATQIAGDPRRSTRGAVRDSLTLLDENGALLRAPPPLIEALFRRDWQGLFTTYRAAWGEARLGLFGHALIEKLLQPRAAITAHVWLVPEGLGSMSDCLARTLAPTQLACKPFAPLPVLGVPGWWAANMWPAFYRDTTVFRPPPKETAARGPPF